MNSDPQERFLSDNPFRVLCIGSDATFVSVRRKADAAEKSAKVGLLGDIPLADVLGTPSLEDLPQVLRGLATDGKRRTCYRIMWPLSTSSIPLLLDGQRLQASHLPSEELAQLLFLNSWLSYLKSGAPTDAAEAFRQFKEMYSDGVLGGRLIDLLIKEGEPEHDGASNVVADARRTVAQALLRQVSEDAAELWNAGRTSGAVSLIEVVLNSGIDRDLEDRALEPVADMAHRLKDRVELATSEMEIWHCGSSTEPPNEVIQLASISRSLMGRLPSAKDCHSSAILDGKPGVANEAGELAAKPRGRQLWCPRGDQSRPKARSHEGTEGQAKKGPSSVQQDRCRRKGRGSLLGNREDRRCAITWNLEWRRLQTVRLRSFSWG